MKSVVSKEKELIDFLKSKANESDLYFCMAYSLIGRIDMKNGQNDEALEKFNLVLERNAEYLDALVYKFELLYRSEVNVEEKIKKLFPMFVEIKTLLNVKDSGAIKEDDEMLFFTPRFYTDSQIDENRVLRP